MTIHQCEEFISDQIKAQKSRKIIIVSVFGSYLIDQGPDSLVGEKYVYSCYVMKKSFLSGTAYCALQNFGTKS